MANGMIPNKELNPKYTSEMKHREAENIRDFIQTSPIVYDLLL